MDDKPSFTCRMYEEKYPEVDEVVMVQVKSIAEMGAYVSLLEYNNIDGMILLSELSRRRIRSVNKLIKVCCNPPVLSSRASLVPLVPPLRAKREQVLTPSRLLARDLLSLVFH